MIVGILAGLCGLFGMPWFCAASVRSIQHVQALSVFSRKNAPGEKPQLLRVYEQRVTNTVVHLLIGRLFPLSLSFSLSLFLSCRLAYSMQKWMGNAWSILSFNILSTWVDRGGGRERTCFTHAFFAKRYVFHFTNIRNFSAWGRNYTISSQSSFFRSRTPLSTYVDTDIIHMINRVGMPGTRLGCFLSHF